MPDSIAPARQPADRVAALPAVPLATLLDSWIIALEGANKSAYTIRSYGDSARALIRWATGPGQAETTGGEATTAITAGQLRLFLAAELARIKPNGQPMSPASAAVHHRNLRVFFGWLAREEPGLVPASPMVNVAAPIVPPKRKPPIADDEQKAMLRACQGDSIEARRDAAIIEILYDTGMRISGAAGLRYVPGDTGRNDVLLKDKLLLITLKGGRRIAVPVGRRACAALDRYIRARARHPRAEGCDWLWLGLSQAGTTGKFTHWGIRQMLTRRAGQAGVPAISPHRYRRTFAHKWLTNGGSEYDLMQITGWQTRDMIDVYAGELGEDRARVAHARFSPGDALQ